MDDRILTNRLINNYLTLVKLYRRGKFEDEVQTTNEIAAAEKFYPADAAVFGGKSFFAEERDESPRGDGRHPRDLQWATANLRETAQYLFEKYAAAGTSGDGDDDDWYREIILYYFRAFSLAYEVDDYFLSVNKLTSDFLIELSNQIKDGIENYLSAFNKPFPADSLVREELVKEILIAALCGVNECYRRHEYKDGLGIAAVIESYADKYHPYHGNERGRGFGLKGLRHFVVGRILTARGDFGDAEREFRASVEAYSESIWQKERVFFQRRETTRLAEEKFRRGEISEADWREMQKEFAEETEKYELSRALALRRCGLANSFGYGFQALVMGKVKDAIRLSSISRAIVNLNTGKIHSAYVDLIYYSAKRAEKSSDRRELLTILKNLKRCRRVFEDLIPAAHYKNRASFQISFVYHYLARWYKERGVASQNGGGAGAAENPVHLGRDRAWHLEKARRYWRLAAGLLEANAAEAGIAANKRLKAESLAILGHAYGNLGLLEKEFGRDGSELIFKAQEVVEQAWKEAEDYRQIKCEVGLSRAAVNKAMVEYRLGSNSRSENIFLDDDEKKPFPIDADERDAVRKPLKNARAALHEVLILNRDNSVRVQATAYLRLTELALLQKDAWHQAREYFKEYLKISPRVEHDFCHQWARVLERRLLQLDDALIIRIDRDKKFSKEKLDEEAYEFARQKAVNFAAMEIEQEQSNGFNKNDSLSSFLEWALTHDLGFPRTTAQKWIKKGFMFEQLRRICPSAERLPNFVERKSRKRTKA